MSVVFCDLTGSTALGERTEPEALRAILRGYYDEMRRILEGHGGTVEKFAGDAVMAVFGVPVAREDDALRAVRAAWQMRSTVTDLGLSARIGVNTGEVVTGAGETLVTGDAVNLAARLEQHASPGEVLIGAETWRLARDAVEMEPVELRVKGKAAPVAAYRLLAVDPPVLGAAQRTTTRLVGRSRELAALRAVFARTVSEQTCYLVTVLGSAGVGKSRLVDELMRGIDATVVGGRCLDYGEGITYWPVVEVLKQLGPRADDTVDILDRGAGSTAEIFWAVRRTLEEAAGERPLIAVFDDIHWGQPTFLELLDHITDLSHGVPVLLLCVARPELLETRPDWGSDKANVATVLVDPLSADDASDLIGVLDENVDPTTRRRVLDTAGGNPLFVKEMLALAREGGDIRVPSSIQALLQARLDQLGARERTVIECGAVEGEVFHLGAVRELMAPHRTDDMDQVMAGLVSKQLVREDRATIGGQGAFRFQHLLIRGAAYESLTKLVRADLHERFADWLAAQPIELVEQDEMLGHHLEKSALYRRELGNHEPAVDARAAARLSAAGSKALARDDMPGALNLLTRALALLPQYDIARPGVLLDLLQSLEGVGDVEREEELIAELESCNDPNARMRGRLARVLVQVRTAPDIHDAAARPIVEEALAFFEETGDGPGLAQAWFAVFGDHWMHSQGGPAFAALEHALEHARRSGDAAMVTNLNVYSLGPLTAAPVSMATVRSKLTELRALSLTSPRMEHAALILESWLAADAGRFDEAHASFDRADAILGEIGLTMHRDLLRGMPAEFALREGRPDEAVRILRTVLDGLMAFGETSYSSTVATTLALALYVNGEPDEAERLAVDGEAMGGTEDVINFAEGRGVRAMVMADRGDLERAEELARSAVDYALLTDFPETHARAYLALAHVLGKANRNDEARPLIELAVERYETRGNVVSAAAARMLLDADN